MKKDIMLLLIASCLVLGFFFSLFLGLLPWQIYEKNEVEKLQRDANYTDTTYLRKSGATTLCQDAPMGEKWINYDFRSWDAGKNWYAVDYNMDEETLDILGKAEEVYPGLMSCLSSWDNLTDYVSKNGSIDPTNPKDLKALEGTGLEVVKK